MKISLVITTRNEQDSICLLLESILVQTKPPDEVVIVDAKSTDQTRELIKLYQDKSSVPIRLITKAGNRSIGRNLGIESAKYPIIAVTDAGNILDPEWLNYLTTPLSQADTNSVAGYYMPLTPNTFAQAVAAYVSVPVNLFNPQTYLPSSRSVAFSKQTWEKVGKYPEHLEYCEDLDFATRLKKHGGLVVEPKALVYWVIQPSLVSFFRQLRNYAMGDVEAGHGPHIRKIVSVYLRVVLLLFLPWLIPVYLAASVVKIWRRGAPGASLLFVPALQVIADMAVMVGGMIGLIRKYKIRL